MRHVTIYRTDTSDEGTFGILSIQDTEFLCHTLELPWRHNQTNISCIPQGVYSCRPYTSAKYRNVWQVYGVEGRTSILIHSGNWAGDVSKGYRTNVEGCILVGKRRGAVYDQKAVISSVMALNNIRTYLQGEEFRLTITGLDF
jgi:hypothetical protein